VAAEPVILPIEEKTYLSLQEIRKEFRKIVNDYEQSASAKSTEIPQPKPG
jgi:hypothetical protein